MSRWKVKPAAAVIDGARIQVLGYTTALSDLCNLPGWPPSVKPGVLEGVSSLLFQDYNPTVRDDAMTIENVCLALRVLQKNDLGYIAQLHWREGENNDLQTILIWLVEPNGSPQTYANIGPVDRYLSRSLPGVKQARFVPDEYLRAEDLYRADAAFKHYRSTSSLRDLDRFLGGV